jgi:hypothetical protein
MLIASTSEPRIPSSAILRKRLFYTTMYKISDAMHIHCCPRRYDMHDTPVGYTETTQILSRQRTAQTSSTFEECLPIHSLPEPTDAATYCS